MLFYINLLVAHRPGAQKAADNTRLFAVLDWSDHRFNVSFVCTLVSLAVWPHLAACGHLRGAVEVGVAGHQYGKNPPALPRDDQSLRYGTSRLIV